MERDEEVPSEADPGFPSGEWVGYYRDRGTNHRQEMHLSFATGRLTGDGADDIGRFAIRGGYDIESREVWWTKTYPGSHHVFYKGYGEIKGIWGLWEIPPLQRDGFHIWPRREGTANARHLTEEEPLRVRVPTVRTESTPRC